MEFLCVITLEPQMLPSVTIFLSKGKETNKQVSGGTEKDSLKIILIVKVLAAG